MVARVGTFLGMLRRSKGAKMARSRLTKADAKRVTLRLLCEVTQWNFAYQLRLVQCSIATASPCCSPSKGVSSLDFGPLLHGGGLFSLGYPPCHASRTTKKLVQKVLFAIQTKANTAKPSKVNWTGRRCETHPSRRLRIIPGGLDSRGDRLSLSAWAPTQSRSQRSPAVLAAFARLLQRALPPVEDEPEGQLSAALVAFLAACESPPVPHSAI